MKALQIFAGAKALAHVQAQGLAPQDIRAIPAAAGGPKGLILGPIDRFLFGEWLPGSTQAIDLVGASIGAWRMATACTANPVAKFAQLEHDYIHQDYVVEPGKKRPTATHISERFGDNLRSFYSGLVDQLLAHPRYRLHVVTSLGMGILQRETGPRMALGFAAAYVCNLLGRQHMSRMLQRVVFSSGSAGLPFAPDGYRTQHCALNTSNFSDALQASCAIPFVLRPVGNIDNAPRGLHWDGGLSDYHLHLDWRLHGNSKFIASNLINSWTISQNESKNASVVLYPHFQQAVVPGWLDKSLKHRHKATPFLDDVLLLAPRPDWVKSLPMGKLPDRQDFVHFGTDLAARVASWQRATAQSQQLADEFAAWLRKPDPSQVQAL
jgi:hypothetical protein